MGIALSASQREPAFRVLAFFTGKEDPAHISFLHEAEQWFPRQAAKYYFSFDTTSDWRNLNSEFLERPLGTGPKPDEIWHSGYYPVVWTNKKYRMVYFNFGHNDIDYEHKYDATNRTLSHTLNNPVQDQLIINAPRWLGTSKR